MKYNPKKKYFEVGILINDADREDIINIVIPAKSLAVAEAHAVLISRTWFVSTPSLYSNPGIDILPNPKDWDSWIQTIFALIS